MFGEEGLKRQCECGALGVFQEKHKPLLCCSQHPYCLQKVGTVGAKSHHCGERSVRFSWSSVHTSWRRLGEEFPLCGPRCRDFQGRAQQQGGGEHMRT